MGDVIPFRRKSAKETHRGATLCRSGFHKWEVYQGKQFDVRRGQLITVYRCSRCGREKVDIR